jgi:RNA polymerase sigma-70 factor (ECF subfamily)
MSAMGVTTLSRAEGAGSDPLEREMERHRRELTGYCYRMLGAGSEAEDAVQETFLRAWRGRDALEHRAALRAWLYRIATNVCLDMPQRAQRRARPMDLASPSTTATAVLNELPEYRWIQPVPDGRVLSADADPAELAALKESIKLAFVAALQHLPPRQRVVLILREVLHWQAGEVAELLGTTTASVNSALQRARATIDQLELEQPEPTLGFEEEQLLERYVSAFERYDIPSFVALLREDAAFTMPPHALWLQGPEEVSRWMLGPGIACDGSRLLRTEANGGPAFASYKPVPGTSYRDAWSLQVLELRGGKISAIHNYLNPSELYESFGLPMRLED